MEVLNYANGLKPKVFFGRYANKLISNDLFYTVGISIGKPKFQLNYSVDMDFQSVYPVGLIGQERDIFREQYFKELDSKEEEILFCLNIYHKFAQEHGKDLIFLCFENLTKKDSFCHRQFLAEWLERKDAATCREIFDLGN